MPGGKTPRVKAAGTPMRLTEALVALVERLEPDPGPDPGTREPADADYAAAVAGLLSQYQPEELWVFAYGSLIWNPVFTFVEQRRAVVRGWHRSFCLKLTRWRGTREIPALMLALDRGGSCTGIVYRLPATDHAGQMGRLVRREIDANPPTNIPRWVTAQTADGPVRALAIVIDPAGPAYAGRLPAEEVAQVLARAAGHWGSAAQYLFRTVCQLEEHGIRDHTLWRLQDLVAREIEAAKVDLPR